MNTTIPREAFHPGLLHPRARREFRALLASAHAQTGMERTVLPIPDAPFQGSIGRTYQDSRANFPKSPDAPAGAPNVLVLMLDDLGFGQMSTFGDLCPRRISIDWRKVDCVTRAFM